MEKGGKGDFETRMADYQDFMLWSIGLFQFSFLISIFWAQVGIPGKGYFNL